MALNYVSRLTFSHDYERCRVKEGNSPLPGSVEEMTPIEIVVACSKLLIFRFLCSCFSLKSLK